MVDTNDAQKSSPGRFVTPEPLAPLVNGLKRAFESSKHADLTVVCQGRQWRVHKVLLCAQSEWFEKSCAECRRAQEGVITFPEDETDAIEAMLYWFYEFDYGISQDVESPLVLDVQVYAVAGKYLLPNLQRLAAAKFEQRAEKEWQSADFAQAIRGVYDDLQESGAALKLTIAQIVNKHRMELFHPAEGSEAFMTMAGKIPGFGRDILIASTFMGDGDEREKYKCPTCKTLWSVAKNAKIFTCPEGCHTGRAKTFWAKYKQA
ncbi:hypothetical protein KC367_g2874 [Hortaea werneckii]|nr:hypothetical protein KC315_g14902 [Hortaea werneckii]KAI7343297.1 hypothetical protein KC354_g15743 [Hortaea werneckii]KAI7465035.1 hypothetical protein KC351_g15152 [Hortaea werneckii]KAI7474036.1 hypothetical protein KC357_g5389 [Hortaea werneckii]KAI7501480.1 hypothetical protein KC367_g2874 [Hortaea werneckii]